MSNIHTADQRLINDIKRLIDDARLEVSKVVSSGLTELYWNIGTRINKDILKNERAEFGKQIVATLSRQLIFEYVSNFEVKNLRRMIQFANQFPDLENVAKLWRQLSWSHFKLLIPQKDEIQRDFYAQMCRIENGMLILFWHIGNRIHNIIIQIKRADYANQISYVKGIFFRYLMCFPFWKPLRVKVWRF